MFNDLKLHKILEYSILGVLFMYIIGGAILRAIIEAKFGVIMMLHFHVPLALFLTVEAILFFATAFTKYLDDQKPQPIPAANRQQLGPTSQLQQDIRNTENETQSSQHSEQGENANEDDTEVLLDQEYTSGKYGG